MSANQASGAPYVRLLEHLRLVVRTTPYDTPLMQISRPILQAAVDCPYPAYRQVLDSLQQLFDGHNAPNAGRLSPADFGDILSIAIRGDKHPSRERTIYLFQIELRHMSMAILRARNPGQKRVARWRGLTVAEEIIAPLFEVFMGMRQDSPWRAAGELLVECIRLARWASLRHMDPNQLRMLGDIVLNSEDFPRSFVAGSIMRELAMRCETLPFSDLWPEGTPEEVIEQFPPAGRPEGVWLEGFAEFIQSAHADAQSVKESVKIVDDVEIRGVDTPWGPIIVELRDPITIIFARSTWFYYFNLPFDDIRGVRPEGLNVDIFISHYGMVSLQGHTGWTDRVRLIVRDADAAKTLSDLLRYLRYGAGVLDHPEEATWAIDDPFNQNDSCPMNPLPRGMRVGDASILDRLPGLHQPRFGRGTQHSFAIMQLPTRQEVVQDSSSYPRVGSTMTNEREGTEAMPATGAIQVRSTESPDIADEDVGTPADSPPNSPPNGLETAAAPADPSYVPESGHRADLDAPEHIDQAEWDILTAQLDGAAPSEGEHEDSSDMSGDVDAEITDPAELVIEASVPTGEPEQQEPGTNTAEPTAQVVSDHISDDGAPHDAGNQPTLAHAAEQGQPEESKPSGDEQAVVDNDAHTPPKNGRLRRPRRTTFGIKCRERSVDWYQDLKVVEGGRKNRPSSGKAKTDASNGIGGRKSESRSHKSLSAKPHPKTSLEKAKGARSPKKQRVKRQVTKTLASARRKRAAATKAKEKIELTREYESIAYDPDDPIESSLPDPRDDPNMQVDHDVSDAAGVQLPLGDNPINGLSENNQNSHRSPEPTTGQEENDASEGTPGETGRPDTALYVSSDTGRSLGEASTLLAGSNLSIPVRNKASSLLGEPPRNQFVLRRPPASSGMTSSDGDIESPCPKRGQPVDLPESVGMEMPKTGPGRARLLETPTPLTDGEEMSDSTPQEVTESSNPSEVGHTGLADQAREKQGLGSKWSARVHGKTAGVRRALKWAKRSARNAFVERLRGSIKSTLLKKGVGRKRSSRSISSRLSKTEMSPSKSISSSGEGTGIGSRDAEEVISSAPSMTPDPVSQRDASAISNATSDAANDSPISDGHRELSEAEAGSISERWRKACQLHQQSSLDILLDTSNRIVRLLKNEEEAIATVVAVYRYGCERLLKQMTEAHDANIEYCQEIQQAIEVELVQRCKEVLRKVDQETEDLDPEETKKLAEALEKRAEKLLNKIEAVANEYEVEESE